MSPILGKVVIFIRVCFIWREVSANGEIFERNITLTWNESRKHCEGTGKMLFDAKSETILMKILDHTNQTWVSATVELSDFVKVPVCMRTSNRFIAKKTFDTDIIGNCLKFCNRYLYAGLKDKECFCFKDAGNLTLSMGCDSTCNNDPFHQCGGNESISLYEKVDKNITQYIAHGYKECVLARNTHRVTKLFTGSCVGQVADGAICEGGNDTACRRHNWTVAELKLCRMDLAVPLRWSHAKKYCAAMGGQLMSSRISGLNVKENSTYWLGFHRVATLHGANDLHLNKADTYCAVARKEADTLVIEGEDCLKKNAVLCQAPNFNMITLSTNTATTTTTTATAAILETVCVPIYVIPVIIGTVAVFIFMTACLARVHRRNTNGSEPARRHEPKGCDTDQYITPIAAEQPPPVDEIDMVQLGPSNTIANVHFVSGRQLLQNTYGLCNNGYDIVGTPWTGYENLDPAV